MEDLQIENHAMIIRMVDWLSKSSELKIIGISLIILIGIGLLQTLTGTRVTVVPFYLIPIALVTLRSTRTAALLTSIVCGVMWISMDVRSPEYVFLWLDAWNNLLRVGVFVSSALLLSRLKGDMVREMKLNADLQAALAEVKQLSGLLPICAWCKRIRDDEGDWQQIETYITVHSEADFTHGICPDCARKHQARIPR
jgi:K+-sensing histidine kinase KdpD